MVEFYQIRQGKLVDGRTLTLAECQEMVIIFQTMLGRTKDVGTLHGWVDPNILYVGPYDLIFRVPAGPRTLLFEKQKLPFWLPELVFKYHGPQHDIEVFFSKAGDIRNVSRNEKVLTGAPLPNISGGSLCIGSSMDNIEFEPDIATMMGSVIGAFMQSAFDDWDGSEHLKMLNDLFHPTETTHRNDWHEHMQSQKRQWLSLNEIWTR